MRKILATSAISNRSWAKLRFPTYKHLRASTSEFKAIHSLVNKLTAKRLQAAAENKIAGLTTEPAGLRRLEYGVLCRRSQMR
jgi:hypothetical protein